MERIVQFLPGYDKRNKDPHLDGGIGGVAIRFTIKGKRGATAFTMLTDWYPEHVQAEQQGRPKTPGVVQPMGADVGYHSPTPRWADQEAIEKECEFLDGRPCYYDGSSLAGLELGKLLLKHGDSVVWKRLEENYEDIFGLEEGEDWEWVKINKK